MSYKLAHAEVYEENIFETALCLYGMNFKHKLSTQIK